MSKKTSNGNLKTFVKERPEPTTNPPTERLVTAQRESERADNTVSLGKLQDLLADLVRILGRDYRVGVNVGVQLDKLTHNEALQKLLEQADIPYRVSNAPTDIERLGYQNAPQQIQDFYFTPDGTLARINYSEDTDECTIEDEE